MQRPRRTSASVTAFLFLLGVVAFAAAPAFAASDEEDERNNQIVLSGTVIVPSTDAIDRVLIFNGDVRV